MSQAFELRIQRLENTVSTKFIEQKAASDYAAQRFNRLIGTMADASIQLKEHQEKLETVLQGILANSQVDVFNIKQTLHEITSTRLSFAHFVDDLESMRNLNAHIDNQITDLTKEFKIMQRPDTEIVRKVLRSLPPVWHTKATIIEDSKYLLTLIVEELIESLTTYEINLKREEAEQPLLIKQKDVALKARKSKANSSEKNSSSVDEEEVSKVVRSFRKFLRKERPQYAKLPIDSKGKSKLEDSRRKSDLIFHECQRIGHMRSECPVFLGKQNKEKVKKPKAMVATLSDSIQKSSETEERKKGECGLMDMEDESPKVWSRSALSWSRCALVLESSCSSACEFAEFTSGLHNFVIVVSTQSACVSTQSASGVDTVYLVENFPEEKKSEKKLLRPEGEQRSAAKGKKEKGRREGVLDSSFADQKEIHLSLYFV
ncbi:hypothetical protein Taro_043259 [Colocasia esculenta]|uniref:Uncharacterized protein n=1 Tax=Colocasia esculenta TaxID=4460 RepID=A0A843WRM4_COLES|nr:hypothetical protein [Colocasia esculenta]